MIIFTGSHQITNRLDEVNSIYGTRLANSRTLSIRDLINDVKIVFLSVTRVLSNSVRKIFNGKFTSRQGISGFLSSGSWILPATAGLTGLTFREEISSIIGKYFRYTHVFQNTMY